MRVNYSDRHFDWSAAEWKIEIVILGNSATELTKFRCLYLSFQKVSFHLFPSVVFPIIEQTQKKEKLVIKNHELFFLLH